MDLYVTDIKFSGPDKAANISLYFYRHCIFKERQVGVIKKEKN